jgi:drug/metabolite transporter (DMT)-like permease
LASSRNDALIRAMPAVFVLIWSTGFIVARFGMPHSPPFSFLAMRYALSVLCFGVWIVLSRAAWPRDRQQVLHLAVTGVLMHAGYLGGVWASVKLGLGAGTIALLVGLQPILTALWVARGSSGAPLTGERVSPRQWIGLALGLGGLALVVWRKLGAGEVTAVNLSLAIFALLCITTGTLYQKRFIAPCDVRTANLVQLAAAFAVTLPLAVLESESMRWLLPDGAVNGQLAGAIAWSVLGLTLGGSSLLYLLIQRGAATKVTSPLYLVPPTTAVMAWAIFNEALTAPMMLGMALTAAGVALVARAP